jgi:hypothetical protein
MGIYHLELTKIDQFFNIMVPFRKVNKPSSIKSAKNSLKISKNHQLSNTGLDLLKMIAFQGNWPNKTIKLKVKASKREILKALKADLSSRLQLSINKKHKK